MKPKNNSSAGNLNESDRNGAGVGAVSLASQLEGILGEMDKYHITHGDMKHSNILVTDNGAVLTDLDSMRVHKCEYLYKIYRAKDIAHLPVD